MTVCVAQDPPILTCESCQVRKPGVALVPVPAEAGPDEKFLLCGSCRMIIEP